jgi:hypothetical protein
VKPAGKSIAILQSNYIPWKGYFDIIASVDEFLIFDDVQFTRRDWRNRNKIVLAGKVHWLTVPVRSKGSYNATIEAIEIADAAWAKKHWMTIRHAYSKAPFFAHYGPMLEGLYAKVASIDHLTKVNELLLRALADMLALPTLFLRSEDIPRSSASPTERLVEICLARGATEYVSGPAARDYIVTEHFRAAGVTLRYANYQGYPQYEQAMTPFDHAVSLIDTLMRCGPQTREHLKSLRDRGSFLDAA